MKFKIYIFCILILSIFSHSQEKLNALSNYNLSFIEKQDSIFITLNLVLKPDWFIYSGHPDELKSSNPTKVDWSSSNLEMIQTQFPKAEKKWIASLNKTVLVYSESIQITAKAIKKQTPFQIKALISYQSCSDKICLRPQTITVSPQNQILIKENSSPKQSFRQNPLSFDKPFWILIFVLFLGGLILNLTPCVYPLITISVGLFGSQTTALNKRVLHSFFYVFGIMVSFSVLGVLTSFSGKLFGSALQSPISQILISIVFLILALSCFGLFEIRLPHKWMNHLYSSSSSKKTPFLFHFSAGLFSGILAAPCIGPFVLALVVYTAEQANVLKGLWTFSILAFGLGFPYIILAALFTLTGKLPKTGEWLSHIKIGFGFILILLSFYYLKGFFSETLYNIILIFIYFSLLLYIVFFLCKKEASLFFTLFKTILIFVCLAFILYNAYQKFGKAQSNLPWKNYSHKEIQRAKNNNKIVLIDFESHIWCIACIKMEEQTYSTSIANTFLKDFVLLKVNVDHHPKADSLIKLYEVQGIPTVILEKRHSEVKPYCRFLRS